MRIQTPHKNILEHPLITLIFSLVMNIKILITVFSFMTMCIACAPFSDVRYDYWNIHSTDSGSYLEKATYFELDPESRFFFVKSIILYNDGYCALSPREEFWKKISKRQFLNKNNVDWGRYKILNGSIVIQYFNQTGCGGGGIYSYTVHQLKGKFILNNSIVLEKFEYYQACGSEYIIKPIDEMVFSFKNIPFPSDSSNWLQKKNFK